ncbi:hypothetical protein Anas_10685 [Armadillidium nasatum]|uniref:Uncharacterized protein n=1 Tax=Armadillidium nasatum TaxID=96803 RepID=A0A5N5TG41_9CRUS|nr:hypothetical protein Anas_10685 [Armadillidium nasatum]
MKSVLILSFLCLQLCFVFGIDEAGCIAKEGCYCAASKECYIRAKETVFSYDDAVKLCEAKGAVLPPFSVEKAFGAKKCCGGSLFPYPFVMYTQPLVKDKCTCVHVTSPTEFCVDDHCTHEESPVNVGCIIPAE